MILPRDIEAYYALQKLNNPDFIGNNTANKAIDFERLKKFTSNPKLEINTDKGSFVVELYMNQAPQTVSNFLSLIASGFYHKFVIHRLVPAFVVQDGCNRGDGWGGPDYTIKSEFTPMTYKPGSIGMASAGPNTESSQWFITLAHMPHLDGRYTNFGCVVSGMSVVQQLEVGTTVLTYKILP